MTHPGVALTFDDGPVPEWTPRLLDALATSGAHATFFVVGERAAAHPGCVLRALAEGHDVQLHCHRHLRHTTLGRAELEADTDAGLAALAAIGVQPGRWRTPWGVLGPDTEAVARERGLELTHWTTDTEDWAGADAAGLLALVAADLRPGAVVLAHDGIGPGSLRTGCGETVALVGPLVAAARAAGLEAGPLPRVGVATGAAT